MALAEVSGTSYHLHDSLISKWNKIKDGKLADLDEDRVYITDGREGTGKSVFTIQQVAYIDPSIIEDEKNGVALPRIPLGNATSWEEDSEWRREAVKRFRDGTLLPRITFNSASTLKAIRKTKSTTRITKAILFDEAFRGMSSKGSLSKENKKLVQVLMEMRQNNLLLWVVSPSFFLLELYPAMLRSNALFHVKKDKNSKKRMVRVFNYSKKALLYQIGLRKGWGYPVRTKNPVNFYNKYPGGVDFEWRYRLKKQMSLRENEDNEDKDSIKTVIERNKAIYTIKEEFKLSSRELSKLLLKYNFRISHARIATICQSIKKTLENEAKEGYGSNLIDDLDESPDSDEETS